jgi:hypothetical protein
MFRHVEVHNPAAIMRKHDENEQDAKRDCRHREEVNRHDFSDMVVQERPPVLRRRLRSSWHPSRHGALGDVDPQLQQFTV